MSGRCRNLGNLRDHIGRNAAIYGHGRSLPILGQNGAEMLDDVRTSIHVYRIVEDRVAKQDDVVHGWYNKKAGSYPAFLTHDNENKSFRCH